MSHSSGSRSSGTLDSKTPGVIPPPLILLAALGLGLAARYFQPRALLPSAGIGYLVGGALIALGLVLSSLTVVHFGRSGTPVSPLRPSRQLVVSGPYRFSRNPDYIGQSCLATGIALALNSLWVLLAILPALAAIRHVVIREESYLRSRFGEDYAAYCKDVARWL